MESRCWNMESRCWNMESRQKNRIRMLKYGIKMLKYWIRNLPLMLVSKLELEQQNWVDDWLINDQSLSYWLNCTISNNQILSSYQVERAWLLYPIIPVLFCLQQHEKCICSCHVLSSRKPRFVVFSNLYRDDVLPWRTVTHRFQQQHLYHQSSKKIEIENNIDISNKNLIITMIESISKDLVQSCRNNWKYFTTVGIDKSTTDDTSVILVSIAQKNIIRKPDNSGILQNEKNDLSRTLFDLPHFEHLQW